jgi:hypothetical protein
MAGWGAAEFQSIGHVIHWSTINRQSPLTPFNAWGDAHRRRFQLHNYILNAPIHVATIPKTPDRETKRQIIPNRKPPATRSQSREKLHSLKKKPGQALFRNTLAVVPVVDPAVAAALGAGAGAFFVVPPVTRFLMLPITVRLAAG